MVQEDMTLDELKQVMIDYYVNLQRIKKADTGNNPELEYQLKIYKNKLSSLGGGKRGTNLVPLFLRAIDVFFGCLW